MTPDEVNYVLDDWEGDGFDYSLKYGTSFSAVKDEKFHKLRLEYLEARNELENYVRNEAELHGIDREDY